MCLAFGWNKMILIIAEKAIAGRRIASLLADSAIKEHRSHNAPFFEFTKNGKEHIVVPLRGHIFNVDFPKNFAPWIGTDLKKLVNARIEYIEVEKGIIALLKEFASKAEMVVMATDSDREGESIALEALECLKEKNKSLEVKRANFSAITKEDIERAFSRLGALDLNFADSANARREIDLVWGAVLTRFLSLVSGRLGKQFLSAGRVQSPTLALIVDREKEIIAFKAKPYWEIQAEFKKEKKFTAIHKLGRIWEKEKALKIMEKKDSHGIVAKVKKQEKEIQKPLPFNTTEFLRAAAGIGFSVGRAMSIAENLYQRGIISYPRTDNTVYPASLDFKKILNSLLTVGKFFNDVKKILSQKKIIPSRGKKATKDHPPIHPVSVPKEELSTEQWRIYELVCRRFFATLSEPAIVESMSVEILMNGEPFIARGQRFIKKGWKEFYPYLKSVEVVLPELSEGDRVKLLRLELLEKETKPPARYSQGSLIKLMEKNNLGTKSTRHETIQKLYSRRYISGRKAITPNRIAFAVIDSLEKYDGIIIKPKMTAELEREMDLIAAGKKKKPEVVNDSRKMLTKAIAVLMEKKDKIGSALREALRQDNQFFSCTRKECDGLLVMRRSSFSKKRFLGCSNYPECTVTYPLPQNGSVKRTDKECPYCGKPMIRVSGRRYSFEMCIDPNCKSKDKWKKKNNKKE